MKILRNGLSHQISIKTINKICGKKYKDIVKSDEIYFGYSKQKTFYLLKPFAIQTSYNDIFQLKMTKDQLFVTDSFSHYCNDISYRVSSKEKRVYICEDIAPFSTLCRFSVPSEKCEFNHVSEKIEPFDSKTSVFFNNTLYINEGSLVYKIENTEIELYPKYIVQGIKVSKYGYYLTQEEIDMYFEKKSDSSFIENIQQNNLPLAWKLWIFFMSIIGTIFFIGSLIRFFRYLVNFILDKCLDRVRPVRRENYEFQEIAQN